MVLVVVLVLVGFVGVKRLATPESWDYAAWYRRDALPQLQQEAALYGGNASCVSSSCHELILNHEAKSLMLHQAAHDGLSCEGCHGPFAGHVRDGGKVADAWVNRDNDLCLSCHGALLGRAQKVAQFDRSNNKMHERMAADQTTRCGNCHDPHAPAPKKVAAQPSQPAPPAGQAAPQGELTCQGGGCHQPMDDHRMRSEQLQGAVHKVLGCETCHGAMASHASEGRKLADAQIRRDSGLCLMCHGGEPQPDQPVKQFDPEFRIHQVAKVTRETACISCHNPHAPK
jgi:hypothetical protein